MCFHFTISLFAQHWCDRISSFKERIVEHAEHTCTPFDLANVLKLANFNLSSFSCAPVGKVIPYYNIIVHL